MTAEAPIAVGGVGGSGTRVVAQVLQALGVHLGADLNVAGDNLWFTLLFKRAEILRSTDAEFDLLTQALVAGLRGGAPLPPETIARVAALARDERPPHPAGWPRERAASLAAAAARPPHPGRWGWKEPNTHVVIERLWQRLPTLRYVHVVRHGVDMALSRNQTQVELWGPQVLGDAGPATPARSLAHWRRVHERMQQLLAAHPQRMYWLDYDALCREPAPQLAPLLAFLDLPADSLERVQALVRPPKPGRHVDVPLEGFAAEDLAYVRSLGYPVPGMA